MGKLNKPVQLYDSITTKKEEMNFSEYSKHLESNPIFCTVFTQDLISSTADIGLQTVDRLIGDNSPLKYHKIDKVPLYSVPMTQLDINFDDNAGTSIDFSADGVIPPGIFEPKPDDFIRIPYLGKDYLFRISNVNVDTVRSNNYYKVEFYYSKDDQGRIEKNTVQNSTVIYDNIGSKSNKCIVSSDDYKESDALLTLLEDIETFVERSFYNEDLGYFVFKNLYDPYLNYFLRELEMFSSDYFDKSIYVNEPVVNNIQRFLMEYDVSFFKLLEDKEIDMLPITNEVMVTMVPYKVGNQFNSYYKENDFYMLNKILVDKSIEKEESPTLTSDVVLFNIYNYVDKEFIDKILSKEHYDDENIICKLRNMIIDHFNSECTLNSGDFKKMFTDLKYYILVNEMDYNEFILLFSLAYIIKYKFNNIILIK